jgi:hypothetical protein
VHFTGCERSIGGREGIRVMFRMQERSEGPDFVTFSISGWIQAEHVPELRALFEGERRRVVLNLKEVYFVSREAVRFLALCEGRGVELRDCPAFVREWIDRERAGGFSEDA